jgi:N-acetylmuramoyl-L-alanine amidase
MVKLSLKKVALICCLEGISCVSFSPVTSSKTWYKPQTVSIPDGQLLSGKKILLDPGHGNRTSGSIGLYGTKESQVNLAVAKILKGLLESHGTIVYMTRESDTTTLWPANSSAREDLAFRCLYRDSLQPDLFVSIHHNGTEDGSRNVNIPKIFYAQGDPDGSLDAAMMINTEFSNLLGLGQSTMQTGNYFILRNTKVPSIIGEPSYLSHPEMEKILHDSTALALESMAYFRGIVNWFTRGVPKIESVKIDSDRNIITAAIKSDVPLDSQITGIYFDQKRLTGTISESAYTAVLPGPLANGNYTLTCCAGNLNGNLATKVYFAFEINRSPGTINVTYGSVPIGSSVPLYITVLDSMGFPVKDGTLVIKDVKDTTSVCNGIALCYHHMSHASEQTRLQCGSIVRNMEITANTGDIHPFQGFIKSADTGFKPQHCVIKYKGMLWATDNNGFFSFLTEDRTIHEIEISVSAKGYSDTTICINRSLSNIIEISPRSSGILFSKRIMIDPEYGGAETGGVSKSGIRACDITRKVAAYIVSMLEEYGADVFLARGDDHTINVTERVLKAQNADVDLYILVRSDSVNVLPYIIHTPGSENGSALADHLAFRWKMESPASVKIHQEIVYVLHQTECPAVGLSLCPLNAPESQKPDTWRRIAHTVVNGIIDYYTQE